MSSTRRSGILLHLTSLPGRFGIGDLGPAAYRFADFLSNAGQTLWQMLPLGPTGYGNSPYMCFSAFAGNPLLISPERLIADGLLSPDDISITPPFSTSRVAYTQVIKYKMSLLRKAYGAFRTRFSKAYPDDYYAFNQQNAFWLEDYALFMALKSVAGHGVWSTWDSDTVARDPRKLVEWRNRLDDQLQMVKFTQYIFFRQWLALREYCHGKGIQIIGDMPIYVAYDSADVWAHRDLFLLDDRGLPIVVAGVPPDYFSRTGQRWGNPIYRWDVMSRSGYRWWIDRFRLNFTLVDMLRLDHFRGFEAYWEIPASERTAVIGRWVEGPGASLFDAVLASLGTVQLIAEDLGVITPEVDALRNRFNFPGMRILQMAFGNDPKASSYRPHNHVRNSVVYTATHDHNTTAGWFTAAPGAYTVQDSDEVVQEREYTLRYLGTDGREIHWDFVRLALGSVADTAILPLQDILGLRSEARMNLPGTLKGNWEWRFTDDMLTSRIADRLEDLTMVYERRPG